MLNGVAKLFRGADANAEQAGASEAQPEEDSFEDLTRLETMRIWRFRLADMGHDIDRRLGGMGRCGMQLGAAIGVYVGLQVLHNNWQDHPLYESTGGAALVSAAGALMGFAVQRHRRHQVFSKTHTSYARMQKIREELLKYGVLNARETEFLQGLEQDIETLRPFQQEPQRIKYGT